MSHAVLAIAAPVAVGLAAGHLVAGLLAGVGGLLATMADRAGPYLMRCGVLPPPRSSAARPAC